MQDAEAYQRLLDIAAHVDAEEGIRQGLKDTKKGKAGPRGIFLRDRSQLAQNISRRSPNTETLEVETETAVSC